jgi:UTP--glucose-1-phosphate uridylyltransferase
MVEKPSPEKAPSNLAAIGRYILTPKIFEYLERTTPGKLKELQLTDALKVLAKDHIMYGYRIRGRRYDAGDKLGFLEATVEFALKSEEFGEEFRRYLEKVVRGGKGFA